MSKLVVYKNEVALCFYSKSKFAPAKYLSNFTEYVGPVGVTSVEKEFCKAKYDHCGVKCPDLAGLSGVELKRLHGKKRLPMCAAAIAEWNHVAPDVMYRLVCNRYDADSKFARILCEYKYFIHQENRASRKSVWGGRMTPNGLVGQNKLGDIFTIVKAKRASGVIDVADSDGVTESDGFYVQSASGVIDVADSDGVTESDGFYVQSASGVTESDGFYAVIDLTDDSDDSENSEDEIAVESDEFDSGEYDLSDPFIDDSELSY